MARTPTSVPRFALRSFNAALEFDGVDDYASVANSASLQPLTGDWTVEFWIKRLGAGTGDYQQVIGSRPWVSAPDKGWAITIGGTSNPGLLGCHFADGTLGFDVTFAASTSRVQFNVWENWIVVFDRTNSLLNLYKNGIIDKSSAALTWPTGSINQTNNVYIGREIDGGNNRRLNAQLAGIRVYNVALDATQASNRYFNNTQITTGLVSIWEMNEGSGTNLVDNWDSNPGTIASGTTWITTSLPSALRSTSAARTSVATNQNLVLYSEQLDNAGWTKRGTCSVTANQAIAPDGTMTADLVEGMNTSGNDFFSTDWSTQNVAAKSSGITPSIWIKKITATGVLRIYHPVHDDYGVFLIDLSLLDSEWNRIWPGHAAATITKAFIADTVGRVGFSMRANSGGPLSAYLWGVQIVQANWPGPYVQTTATIVDTGEIRSLA